MEEKKNYTPVFIIGVFIILVILIGGLTNYKDETLVCNKTENICTVNKTNLFNMKFKTELIKYSDIAGVSYYAQKVKGNRYGKGYREYFIAFNSKSNDKIKIFSQSYYEKKELNSAIKELKTILSKGNSTNQVEYKRNN
jgi:hypothetical protein